MNRFRLTSATIVLLKELFATMARIVGFNTHFIFFVGTYCEITSVLPLYVRSDVAFSAGAMQS